MRYGKYTVFWMSDQLYKGHEITKVPGRYHLK